MKRSIKTTILSCLAGLATLALALGFVFVNRNVSSNLSTDGNATLQGDYGKNTSALMNAVDGEAVDVYEGATYTAFDTMSKISTDGNYLLIVVGIDDVSAYDALGMSIKKDGVEQVTADDFDGKTYYESISYTDGSTQTLVDIFGETGAPEGMLVFEVAYDVNVAYRVTPSFTKTDDTTVYAQMKVNKTYEVTEDTATCTEGGFKTYTFGNDSYQVASVAKGHTYTYTANEATVGTQTMTIACACGDSQTVSPDAYHNITSGDMVGANTHFYNTKMTTERPSVSMRTETSGAVGQVNKTTANGDVAMQFYGGLGMRFYVYAETAGTATAIFKAASGYITTTGTASTDTNWKTSDMQFNKIFATTVNGDEVVVDDSVVLKGYDANGAASGAYGLAMGNWTYVPLTLNLQKGVNEVVITSLQPLNAGYTQESDGIYKDGVKITTWAELKPAFVYSDVGEYGTQSSPNVDSIAFYGDNIHTIADTTLAKDETDHYYVGTCGHDKVGAESHEWTETVKDEYLASTATSTQPAKYYKHCSICDYVGDETFDFGEPVAMALVVTTAPTKSAYTVGETFDGTGMVVSLDESGQTRVLNADEYTVSGGDNLGIGSIVTITLNSDTAVTANAPIAISSEIDITDDMTTAEYATHNTLGGYATGGYYATNFKEGHTVTFSVNSANAGVGSLTLKAASGYVTEYSTVNYYYPTEVSAVQANEVFELYVNGQKVDMANSVMIGEGATTTNASGELTLLAKYVQVKLSDIYLEAGDNEIELVFLKQTFKNADVTNTSGQFKEGVLSSPYLDTITVTYGKSN